MQHRSWASLSPSCGCTQAEAEALLHGPVAGRIAVLQAQRNVDELALEAAYDADDQLNAVLRALQYQCVADTSESCYASVLPFVDADHVQAMSSQCPAHATAPPT